MNSIQSRIAQNVIDRGYAEGWTPDQMVCRQIAKLVEELGEAVAHLCTMGEFLNHPVAFWADAMDFAARRAKIHFDSKNTWDDVYLDDLDALRTELADIQVVLFVAAHFLGFDITQAALDKSNADVKRGVRNGQ